MTLLKSAKDKIYQFIHILQNYLKTDLFYLIKGGSWLTLGKIISLASAFLLSLAWANWIDKEIYGNYQYIFSLVGIISVLSLPELGTAIIQSTARGLEGSFISGFKTQLKWGVLASIASLGIAGYYWIQGDRSLLLCFLIIAVFLPFFNAFVIYTCFLSGRKLFDIRVKYDSIVQVISVIIMISTLFLIKTFLSDTPIYIVLPLIIGVYFLSRTFLRFVFFTVTRIRFKPNSKEDPKTISFGKHLTLSGAFDIVSSCIDKILLFHYLGAVQLAVYSFAIVVPQQIKTLLKYISDLALPKFAVRPREEIRKTLLRKICYLAALISAIVLVYIIVAPLLYQTFFPKYLSSVFYSRLYALSIIPLCFSLGYVFKAKMMTKQIYQVQIFAPIVRTVLFLTLIPLYGILGAIVAMMGTRVLSALFALYLYRKI